MIRARFARSLATGVGVCAALVGAAAIACVGAFAAVPGSSPRITLSDLERDYELRALGISPEGAVIHLMTASSPKGSPSAVMPLLWTVADASGKVVSQQDPLARLPSPLSPAIVYRGPDAGTGFVVTSDGIANLLLQTTTGDCLLRLRRAPEAPVVVPIDLGRGAVVRRMLAAGGDRLLLIGAVGEQPLVAVIGLDGTVLTRHQIREAGVGIVGAVVEPDSSIVVVGAKGMFPNATTWVGRLSPGGAAVAATEFPGNPADVARGSDGTTLILIGSGMSEMTAKAIGPTLAERWTRTLVSGLSVPTPFHVAAVSSGGFVVTGTKERALWVSRLTVDGSEMWTDTVDPSASPEMEMTNHVELTASRDACAVAYSAFVVVGREQRRMVRTFQFPVK